MIEIELKAIKNSQAQSQETFAYTAKLYADGRYIADIGNDGHGGADRVYKLAPGITWADYEKVGTRVASEHPKEDLLNDGELYDATLEGVCHNLVAEHLISKDVSRLLRNKVVFFKGGLPASGQSAPLYQIKIDTKKGQTAAAIAAHLKRSDPDAYILNELSLPDAIGAYKRAI